jgi:hypothetical protein
MAMSKNVGPYFTSVSGPLATVIACNFCRTYSERVQKGIAGVGRGYGLAATSTARSLVLAHVKAAHPAEYKAQRDKERGCKAERVARAAEYLAKLP